MTDIQPVAAVLLCLGLGLAAATLVLMFVAVRRMFARDHSGGGNG